MPRKFQFEFHQPFPTGHRLHASKGHSGMSQQPAQEPQVRRRRRANLFTNDLRSLIYAFGDVVDPYPETVAVLEDILQEYIVNVCQEAYRVARTASRQKIKVDDFKFALRHDPRKLGRVEELLIMQKEIAEARKTFDNSEGKSLRHVDEQPNETNEENDNDGGNNDDELSDRASKSGRDDGTDAHSVADSSTGKKRKKEKKEKKDKEKKKARKMKEKESKAASPQSVRE